VVALDKISCGSRRPGALGDSNEEAAREWSHGDVVGRGGARRTC
jgi:hypothetical protein